MTKKELIEKIAEATGLAKSDVSKTIDAYVDVLAVELKAAGRTVIPGIGIATVKTRAARDGRNPKTGEAMRIEAKQIVAIKAAKGFGL